MLGIELGESERRNAKVTAACARRVIFEFGEMVLVAVRREVVWDGVRVMKCVRWEGNTGGSRRGRPGFWV